jgi:hypothetical protein
MLPSELKFTSIASSLKEWVLANTYKVALVMITPGDADDKYVYIFAICKGTKA